MPSPHEPAVSIANSWADHACKGGLNNSSTSSSPKNSCTLMLAFTGLVISLMATGPVRGTDTRWSSNFHHHGLRDSRAYAAQSCGSAMSPTTATRSLWGWQIAPVYCRVHSVLANSPTHFSPLTSIDNKDFNYSTSMVLGRLRP